MNNESENKHNPETQIRQHYRLLSHREYGVTELRIFDGRPRVAYTDNEDDMVSLCLEIDGKVSGVYVGVNPRPAEFFDYAPNRWQPARSHPQSNCAGDNDIEYLTTCFIDIDVVSKERQAGYPASEQELEQTLKLAGIIAGSDGLALSAVIACSGNGHYVITPIVPIAVDSNGITRQYKTYYGSLMSKYSGSIHGTRVDNVSNSSRVMRVVGTRNKKGRAFPQRPHRRAYFVTEPMLIPSMALHHQIVNTEIPDNTMQTIALQGTINGDLNKLEKCEFIKWCRDFPAMVSEPQWFGLISNLARLKGGPDLIHEISRLDENRYDYQQTQVLIERTQKSKYRPVNCKNLINKGRGNDYGCFECSRLSSCTARAPMYLAALRTAYSKY